MIAANAINTMKEYFFPSMKSPFIPYRFPIIYIKGTNKVCLASLQPLWISGVIFLIQ